MPSTQESNLILLSSFFHPTASQLVGHLFLEPGGLQSGAVGSPGVV